MHAKGIVIGRPQSMYAVITSTPPPPTPPPTPLFAPLLIPVSAKKTPAPENRCINTLPPLTPFFNIVLPPSVPERAKKTPVFAQHGLSTEPHSILMAGGREGVMCAGVAGGRFFRTHRNRNRFRWHALYAKEFSLCGACLCIFTGIEIGFVGMHLAK